MQTLAGDLSKVELTTKDGGYKIMADELYKGDSISVDKEEKTLSIDPNGGKYKGSEETTEITGNAGDTVSIEEGERARITAGP